MAPSITRQGLTPLVGLVTLMMMQPTSAMSTAQPDHVTTDSLTILRARVLQAKLKADLAFNNSCASLVADAAMLCPYLREDGQNTRRYPALSSTHSTQMELLSDMFDVTHKLMTLTGLLADQLLQRHADTNPTAGQAAHDELQELQIYLEAVLYKVEEMAPQLVRPSTLAALEDASDITTFNYLNLPLVSRVAWELGKMAAELDAAISGTAAESN